MEYYAPSTFPVEASSDPRQEWRHAVPSSFGDAGVEAGWQLSLPKPEEMEAHGQYPERPGEPDCVFYMRTGSCNFGINCRYNHPANWKLVSSQTKASPHQLCSCQAAAIARNKGEYPERPGQPECQFFMKTGTCKFGSTCKYHHPREKGATPQLNLGEKECAYYMRTGVCKYGLTCKFSHPQPQTFMSGSSLYATSTTSTAAAAAAAAAPTAQPQYSWPVRSAFVQSPRMSSTGYPSVVPQGIVSMAAPGWTAYPGPVSPLASPEGAQHLGLIYSPHGEAGFKQPMAPPAAQAPPAPAQAPTKEAAHPERPGMPECQFYMKTGECKFGAACRYHHPKDKVPGFTLSAQGLPLRPGATPCAFFARMGSCKFGSACRYDHSPGGSEIPVAPYPATPAQVPVEGSRAQHSSSASEEIGRSGSEELSNVQSSITQVG